MRRLPPALTGGALLPGPTHFASPRGEKSGLGDERIGAANASDCPWTYGPPEGIRMGATWRETGASLNEFARPADQAPASWAAISLTSGSRRW